MKRTILLGSLILLSGAAAAQAPRTDKEWTIETIDNAPPYTAPPEAKATTTAAAKKEVLKRLGITPSAAQLAIVNGLAQPGTARWAEWPIVIDRDHYARVIYHNWGADLPPP